MQDTTSIVNMIELVRHIIQYLYVVTGLFLMILGYGVLVGIPAVSYFASYKSFKEIAMQDRSGIFSTIFIHAKAASIAIFAAVIASLIFIFIFRWIIGLSGTEAEVIQKVLAIRVIFN